MLGQMETGQPALAHRTQQLLLPSATAQDTHRESCHRPRILAQYTAQESATCDDATERKAWGMSVLLEYGKRKQTE